jgi:hypothetical protein
MGGRPAGRDGAARGQRGFFDGYLAVLIRLDRIPVPELAEVVTEAWLTRAPKRLAAQLLADHPRSSSQE